MEATVLYLLMLQKCKAKDSEIKKYLLYLGNLFQLIISKKDINGCVNNFIVD